MNKHTRRFARISGILIGALLSTAGIACSSSGGGGGSCGTAQAGEACETDADCLCSLDCKDKACIAVVGSPGVSATAPESSGPSVPISPMATEVCNAILTLPCVPEEVRSNPEQLEQGLASCSEGLSETIRKFQDAGCSTETTKAFDCMVDNIACPSGGEQFDMEDFLKTASDACPSEVTALQACAEEAEPAPTEGCEGGGISCGSAASSEGEVGGTCTVSYMEDNCEGAQAHCENREDADGTSFLCTCSGGPKDASSFVAYADDCCQVYALVQEACGNYLLEAEISAPPTSPPPSNEESLPEGGSEPTPDPEP